MLIGLQRHGVATILPKSAVPRMAQVVFLRNARSQRGMHAQQFVVVTCDKLLKLKNMTS